MTSEKNTPVSGNIIEKANEIARRINLIKWLTHNYELYNPRPSNANRDNIQQKIEVLISAGKECISEVKVFKNKSIYANTEKAKILGLCKQGVYFYELALELIQKFLLKRIGEDSYKKNYNLTLINLSYARLMVIKFSKNANDKFLANNSDVFFEFDYYLVETREVIQGIEKNERIKEKQFLLGKYVFYHTNLYLEYAIANFKINAINKNIQEIIHINDQAITYFKKALDLVSDFLNENHVDSGSLDDIKTRLLELKKKCLLNLDKARNDLYIFMEKNKKIIKENFQGSFSFKNDDGRNKLKKVDFFKKEKDGKEFIINIYAINAPN